MFSLGTLFVVLICSWLLTGLIRRYALKVGMLDIPNHRSSHACPTPRGGGVSFVIMFLSGILILYSYELVDSSVMPIFMGSALAIALIGFIDDRIQISAKWRLLGHFTASAFAVYWLQGMPSIAFFFWTLPQGVLLNVVATFYAVWFLNLYNFMDGIDGLAAIQAVTVCLGGAFLYYLLGDFSAMLLPLLLGFAVLGFLYWNFPPAKIFMGDVGSGFLGFVLAILSIQAAHIKTELFYSWLILSAGFLTDATITLVRRGLAGQAVFEAHRSHAYQHAACHFGKHLPVTLAVLIINLFWLLPLASLAALNHMDGCLAVLLAYIPIVMLALKFKAGKAQGKPQTASLVEPQP
ncbi:MraY family glycosyltransferase [Legionella jordanis]|uniref:MraY family glycosyltransferase n=1 Tax=Legionella jordanis TaxID=456 RepID=UPI0010411F2A|nr:glycosyltransferase family 4 protein [Legionella jordanis]